jgi:hypothetical protein
MQIQVHLPGKHVQQLILRLLDIKKQQIVDVLARKQEKLMIKDTVDYLLHGRVRLQTTLNIELFGLCTIGSVLLKL